MAISRSLIHIIMYCVLLTTSQALQRYKTQTKGTETSDYEAMQAADAFFVTEAENCVRRGSDWDYASERASLQVCLYVYMEVRMLDIKDKRPTDGC